MKDENKGKLVKTSRPIKNQILKFWKYSQKAVKQPFQDCFIKGYISQGHTMRIFQSRKKQGMYEQGQYDKEHINLNESLTLGSVDQGL
jgi:hypothetical protein